MSLRRIARAASLPAAAAVLCAGLGLAQEPQPPRRNSSFSPVVPREDFATVMRRMSGEKAAVVQRQKSLLAVRYDLGDRAAPGVTMFRGTPVQDGVRARPPAGVTWESLATLTPDQIRERGAFPAGLPSLPHPNNPEGGMLFPQFHIDDVKRQEQRDLQRFDLDFDLPDHSLPEFPAPIFLITRTDLGNVSQGKLLTIDNFFEIFDGILNPKQLEGLRLLLTPFPQQQFNQTEDRRTLRPSPGVACLDCHSNGHTNGHSNGHTNGHSNGHTNGHTNASTHLIGDIRPQEFRWRIDTPSLRGVNIQRLFGSQRASPPPLAVGALAPFGLVFFAVLVAFTVGFKLPWSAAAALLLTVYASHVDPLTDNR